MTASAATSIKIHIALLAIDGFDEDQRTQLFPEPPSPDNIDDIVGTLKEHGAWYDAIDDFRCSGMAANVPGAPQEWSRHYENTRVVTQLPGGQWVSWLFWHGGGKHGDPGAVEWLDDTAVFVTMTERLEPVKHFSLTGPA